MPYVDPEKQRVQQRRYRALNGENIYARQRKWARENREKMREYHAQYRARNADKIRTQRQEYADKYRIEKALRSAQRRAERGGVAYDLTRDWYAEQLLKGCALSGLPFYRTRGSTHGSPSVDRIKPGGDYTQANCRLILNVYNCTMSNYGLENTLTAWLAVAERRGYTFFRAPT